MGMNDITTAIGSVRIGMKRRAEMEEENDDHKADDHRFFQQVALQRFNRER